MNKEITVVKASGAREPFDRMKVESSLMRAGATHEIADEIVNHIIRELTDGMSTSQIGRHANFLLQKHLRPASYKYSLRQAIMDLGPSGFPFEDFISYIFKEKGYEVKTDQVVLGGCVEHEIDVVAWNENKLVMAEAKFHNELGLKTDVKVVLYVKARMDDLKEVMHDYGKGRYVDEAWLVTNTKFTNTAIHYGECKGIKLVGWNYPKTGNLQDMVVDSNLHPVTCLTTLSGSQKKSLLSQGVVLCTDLVKNTEPLRSLGFNDDKIKMVLDEISIL